MDKPSLVYLDSNVLISVCDGHKEDLRTYLDSTREGRVFIYPFSAEQIDEMTLSSDPIRSSTRLAYLSDISQNIYFCNSVTEFGFVVRSPSDVHQTINEVVVPFQGHEILENIAPYAQRREARASLGLEPTILNNLSGREAVAAIDKALVRVTPLSGDAPRSLRELVKWSKRFSPRSPRGVGEATREKKDSETRNYEICALFSMLDSFGFWPDDAKVSGRGSGFADGRHVFNASYYQMLVSEDKKMRAKAEAVYEVLQLPTQVLSADEFMQVAIFG